MSRAAPSARGLGGQRACDAARIASRCGPITTPALEHQIELCKATLASKVPLIDIGWVAKTMARVRVIAPG